MMIERLTRNQLLGLLVALGVFGLLSGLSYVVGPEIAHGVAIRFHETRVAAALDANDYELAENELKAWHWIDPANEAVVHRLSEVHLLQDEWMDARDAMRRTGGPADGDYNFCRIMTLIESGAQSDAALSWANRAAASSRDTEDPESELLRAHALRKTGRRGQATEHYLEIVKNHPRHAEAHYQLAQARQRAGNMRGALEDLDLVLESSEKYRYTPEYIGRRVRALETIEHLSNALQQSDNQTGPRMENMALALIEVGRWNEGFSWFERAQAAGGTSWQTEYWIAMKHELDGDVDAALAGYRRAAQRNSKAEVARQQVGRLSPKN